MSYRLSVLAVAGLLAVAPPAAAQTIQVVPDGPITIEDARDIAIENGLTEIESIELDTNSGRWEVEGTDIDDRDVEMEIDANTGAVLRIDR